jgi:hypothetical protein
MGDMADYINEDYGPEDDSGTDWELYQRLTDGTAEYAGRQALRRVCDDFQRQEEDAILGVQTSQEARSEDGQWWGSWPVPFAVYTNDKEVRVAAPQNLVRVTELSLGRYSRSFLVDAGTQRRSYPGAEALVEPRACRCGCGLPCPVGQAYADADVCRKNQFTLFHPTLDLTGLSPEWARKALRMCQEAVRAAKLGQERATVAADALIAHKNEVKPDVRPSCRIRLDPEFWDMLGKIKEEWGLESVTAAARLAIAKERQRCLEMERQAQEQGEL